jgi:hypothetical protein
MNEAISQWLPIHDDDQFPGIFPQQPMQAETISVLIQIHK